MKIFLLLCSTFLAANVSAGEWIDVPLTQIEVVGPGGTEGVYFAKDSPYQTPFACSQSRYVLIKDPKLADRAISLALYAKSTSGRLKVYVTGCDAQGYVAGVNLMLL